MKIIFVIALSVLFVFAMAVPVLAQDINSPDVRQAIIKRLLNDGFYLGNPGFSDGLRYIEYLPDNRMIIWGLGDFRYSADKSILPLDELTPTFIDLSDPALRVTVGNDNRYLGQLMDSCLATGYSEKYLKGDTFWQLEGQRKKP
ncbi:MAG: hypothetical protein ABIH38_01890 [Patescibacteria group bacterium]